MHEMELNLLEHREREGESLVRNCRRFAASGREFGLCVWFYLDISGEAMAGPAPGKPLITFGDMLRDHAERRPAAQPEPDEPDSPTTMKQKKIAGLRAVFYSSDPKAATPSTGPNASSTQFEGLDLVDAFERVYADLTEALSGDGDEWVGLSEQLSTVLKTANQLIATARNETGPLADQIRSLQALVERGRSALANAQTSMDQT